MKPVMYQIIYCFLSKWVGRVVIYLKCFNKLEQILVQQIWYIGSWTSVCTICTSIGGAV